jgi:hypothetical protein
MCAIDYIYIRSGNSYLKTKVTLKICVLDVVEQQLFWKMITSNLCFAVNV